jgi:hypothetical protein
MFHRGLIVFERRIENLGEEKVLLGMTNWRKCAALRLEHHFIFSGNIRCRISVGVRTPFNLFDVDRH